MNSRRAFASHLFGPAAVLYGLLIYACLPGGIAALDDDFGYLRSVVATLQHGRPWTDDWLEPWAASFSSISALLYLATRTFYGATYGLLPILAAISFAVTVLLLRDRGLGSALAIFLAGIGLTFPTVFWKTIQYTGMALYIPCLLGAIWACERRRWWIFLMVWSLALATRQSAVAWIMLPLAVAAQVGHQDHWRFVSKGFWQPTLAAAAGAAVFLALWFTMNKTHAQALVNSHVIDQASLPRIFQTGLLGLGVFLVMAGIGMLILRLCRPGFSAMSSLRPLPVLMGLALAALVLCSFDLRPLVFWEHGAIAGPAGWLYLKVLVLAGAAGWMFRGGTMRPEMAATAAASLALVSLRGAIWDYYFLDIAALGLFGAWLRNEPAIEPFTSDRRWRLAAGAVLVMTAAANGLLVLDFKAGVDRSYALCRLSERAMREGRLLPAELSFAPFGFRAWHLYSHYIRHEGKGSANIAGFDCYLRPGAVEVGQGYSRLLHLLPRFRHEPPADRHNLIAGGSTRFLWFFRGEYYLLRFKTEADAPAAVTLPSDYRAQPFPLSEAEWRESICRAPAPSLGSRSH